MYDRQKLLLFVVVLMGRLMWGIKQISHCCRPVLTYWLTDLCRQWLTECSSCTAFCCNIFFFVTTVVYSRSWDFLYGSCERYFVSELNSAFPTRQIFKKKFFEWLSRTSPFASINSWALRFFEHRYFTR